MRFKDGLSILFDNETERYLIVDDIDGMVMGYFDEYDTWVKCRIPFLINPSRLSPVDGKKFIEDVNGKLPSVFAFYSVKQILDKGKIPPRNTGDLPVYVETDYTDKITYIEVKHSTRNFGYINNYNGLYYINNGYAYLLPEDFDLSAMDKYKAFDHCIDCHIKVSTVKTDYTPLFEYRQCFYGQWGLIDIHGKEIIPCEYIVMYEARHGFIVRKGEINFTDDIDSWKIDLVSTGFGLIDFKGNELIPCKYDELFEPMFTKENKGYYICQKKDHEYGYNSIYDINKREIITDCDFYFNREEYTDRLYYEDSHIVFVTVNENYEDRISIFSLETNTWEYVDEPYGWDGMFIEGKVYILRDGKRYKFDF